jgi:hypothetical protein
MGSIVAGVLFLQFLLVGGYLSLVDRSSKRRELFGSLLAAVLLLMWIAVLALYAAD